MSDLAKWKIHGPVKTLRSEFATWDIGRNDWQPGQHVSLASFRPDGKVSATEASNPDGSVAHSRWFYEEAGRLKESHSWMNDGPVDIALYLYDEAGRHIQTVQPNNDGTQTDFERCSYATDGTRTKVRFLSPSEVEPECTSGGAYGASTGYGIEGTDTSYAAPGARTMTATYDHHDLPREVLFHDTSSRLVNRVVFQRDREGRLLSEETRSSEASPLQGMLDHLPSEHRESMAALLQQVLGESFASTTYTYDSQGRLIKRESRMGNLGGNSITYRYEGDNDPIEETTEHRSREANFNENGVLEYSSDRVSVQHNRFEYRYDEHGNWTERIVSLRRESEPDFTLSNMERRAITYYDG